ncbi:TRAP dicarboxylate transporter, DctP subunit [Caldalkalibacillus thermarum TA2.A1]|uniref:DctP family TRAP transporter solute-binding subunit n=2 Tax=Caldalkalibacillus TaxID=379065 RepID=F5L616_CALTT|nr:TRAP dicarboxylate transporter, DctP subunit [Caldalkalibacillus thermarum TA2.A1]QZT35325.1 DctP family TRAP transporter solute-binding subunit [Caldalkalibacillus thermarum TA2.A1]
MLQSWLNRCKHLLAICVPVVLTLMLGACHSGHYPQDHEQLSEDERIVIRFSHVVGEETPKGLAARRFAELVKQRTSGYVEVQVFSNSYLYKDGEEIDALLQGDVQMIAPAISKLSELVPEWQVIDLPFAFNETEEVLDYVFSPVGQELLARLEKKGIKTLDVWDNGFKQLTNSQRPIQKPEDAAGLRFRIMPSEVLDRQFRQLGAQAEVYAFNEVFQLLEHEQIDGQENTLSNIVSRNLHYLQNYITISNHGYLGYFVIINQEFWDGLPEEVQEVIQTTMDEVTEWQLQLAQELNAQHLEEIEACQCIHVTYLDEEEREQWFQRLQPVYQFYAEKYGHQYVDSLPRFKDADE